MKQIITNTNGRNPKEPCYITGT